MPTYEYICGKCGQSFDRVLTIRAHEDEREKHRKVRCPHCGSQRTEQRPSTVQVVTSSKS